MSNLDETIRRRAYDIWQREGRPEGRHHDHWHQAREEVMAETGTPAKPPKEAKPAKPAKPAGRAPRETALADAAPPPATGKKPKKKDASAEAKTAGKAAAKPAAAVTAKGRGKQGG